MRIVSPAAAALSLVAAAGVLAGCAAQGSDPTTAHAKPDAAVTAQVTQLVRNYADSQPATVELVQTTRRDALRLLDAGTSTDDRPVALVVATGGHFTSKRTAPGAEPPTGSTLTAVIDLADATVLDLGIGDSQPRIETLGTVQHVSP